MKNLLQRFHQHVTQKRTKQQVFGIAGCLFTTGGVSFATVRIPTVRVVPSVQRDESMCWKMCASTTVASLKFPLQDPLQQAASGKTDTISDKLNCFIKQAGLFHLTFIRNYLVRVHRQRHSRSHRYPRRVSPKKKLAARRVSRAHSKEDRSRDCCRREQSTFREQARKRRSG